MTDELDARFRDATRWRDEATRLREILLDCGLEESVRWGKPTYRHHDGNVVQIQRMNEFMALLFFKGALLEPDALLEPPGENSRIARRMIFTSVAEVEAAEPALRRHLARAMQLEEEGARVEVTDDWGLPPELEDRLAADAALRAAFSALTPGRRRGWALRIGGAKQSATRQARIDKAAPAILAGKGVNDF